MRRSMIPLSEVENMMEEKDSKIQDLEEEIEVLKEELVETKRDYAYFTSEIVRVIEESKR